eukprot:1157838-Pelagomonas_calceolata.AAC.4
MPLGHCVMYGGAGALILASVEVYGLLVANLNLRAKPITAPNFTGSASHLNTTLITRNSEERSFVWSAAANVMLHAVCDYAAAMCSQHYHAQQPSASAMCSQIVTQPAGTREQLPKQVMALAVNVDAHLAGPAQLIRVRGQQGTPISAELNAA